MKWLKRFGLIAAFLYAIGAISLYFLQDDILFLPDRLQESHEFRMGEEVELLVDQDVYLNCIHIRRSNPIGVILYLHGNRGSNRRCLRQAQNLMSEGYDLFMPDYRGYGKSDGVMENEKQAFSDMQVVYNYLSERYAEASIVVVGYSLGSAMASHLASKNSPSQLALVAPFYSIVDMKNQRLPIVPTFLLKYPFCSNRALATVRCPIRIYHGTEDELIPFHASERLAQVQPESTTLVPLEGVGHRGAIFSRVLRNDFTRTLHR